MMILRWLSVLVAVAALVRVIVGDVRGFRIRDPDVLRRSARRLGWGVAGAFVFATVLYSIAAVACFGPVASARPQDKAAVLSGCLDEPAVFLQWSVGLLVVALGGVVVMRFRAGYLTKESKR
jgi:hypothetical protein